MLLSLKKDKWDYLNFFIIWRVWKMRNNSLPAEKRSHCERSSSIRATNTSLKPKAEALRMAVKQMRMLNFKKVAFISDCKPIICVATIYRSNNHPKGPYHRVSMLQDIMESSKSYDFSFCYVPTNRLTLVDELAKNSRCNNQSYVIRWF